MKTNNITWYYAFWMVKVLENVFRIIRSEQLIKFAAILKPNVCIISEEHKYGVPIVSPINCCYTFWRTTQQQKTAQTWDLARLLIDRYSIIFEILGFRHSTVFILVFNGLTVKNTNKPHTKEKKGAMCQLVGIKWWNLQEVGL